MAIPHQRLQQINAQKINSGCRQAKRKATSGPQRVLWWCLFFCCPKYQLCANISLSSGPWGSQEAGFHQNLTAWLWVYSRSQLQSGQDEQEICLENMRGRNPRFLDHIFRADGLRQAHFPCYHQLTLWGWNVLKINSSAPTLMTNLSNTIQPIWGSSFTVQTVPNKVKLSFSLWLCGRIK